MNLFDHAVTLFREGGHDREAIAALHQSLYNSCYAISMRSGVAAWLGWAHQTGRGVPQDHYTALQWYRLAAKRASKTTSWIEENLRKLEALNPTPKPTPEVVEEHGLGRVMIRRGESYKYRLKGNCAEVTITPDSPYDKAVALLWCEVEKREEARRKSNLPEVLDETLRRDYPLFELRLARGTGSSYGYHKGGIRYTILAPRTARFEERLTREEIIRQGLRLMQLAAEEYLPKRLKELSESIGLGYSRCQISHGTKTLGSFNQDKRIKLSFHLMKRTPIEIDAVIVHELCHGVEFNHDNEFHYAVQKYGGMAIYHADRHLYDHYTPIDI